MIDATTASASVAHIAPPPLLRLWNKREPASIVAMRAADLPGIQALPLRRLIPSMPPAIWAEHADLGPTDPDAIRRRSREQAAAIDWSRIRRGQSVNLIANPHGFYLAGEAYVAMLEELQAHLRDTVGARVRLRIAESMGHIENPDWVKHFRLHERFEHTKEVPQIGRGIAAETRLGRFWLNHELFNADHFVHTHVTEMREGYLHRMVDRLFKPFGMAYTRLETRSAYHLGFGPRTGQMVSRAVFESEFIRKCYAASMVLDTSPEGVVGVHGANDLGALDRRLATGVLRNYGALIRLMAAIEDCICVFDGHGSGVYCYAGGIAFDNLFSANIDFLDLDNLGLLAMKKSDTGLPGLSDGMLMGYNQAIKYIVMNYMAAGVPQAFIFKAYPTVVVGDTLFRWHANDPSSATFHTYAQKAPTLPDAMAQAMRESGTDRVLVYDRTPGVLRVSDSLAEFLVRVAPSVIEDVEKNRLPKWLAQRGLSP